MLLARDDDDAVLFLIKLFVFDSGPENGATRTSCGPGREGKHACTQSSLFVDPCGFHDFWGTKFLFENWDPNSSPALFHVIRLVRVFVNFSESLSA